MDCRGGGKGGGKATALVSRLVEQHCAGQILPEFEGSKACQLNRQTGRTNGQNKDTQTKAAKQWPNATEGPADRQANTLLKVSI